MEILKEEVWVIMSKDRKYIAKGSPRNRYLISINNHKDKKRILTYSSKDKAESGFKDYGFFNEHIIDGYGYNNYKLSNFLEAVKCDFVLTKKD
jgi:hypothetical protein